MAVFEIAANWVSKLYGLIKTEIKVLASNVLRQNYFDYLLDVRPFQNDLQIKLEPASIKFYAIFYFGN